MHNTYTLNNTLLDLIFETSETGKSQDLLKLTARGQQPRLVDKDAANPLKTIDEQGLKTPHPTSLSLIKEYSAKTKPYSHNRFVEV